MPKRNTYYTPDEFAHRTTHYRKLSRKLDFTGTEHLDNMALKTLAKRQCIPICFFNHICDTWGRLRTFNAYQLMEEDGVGEISLGKLARFCMLVRGEKPDDVLDYADVTPIYAAGMADARLNKYRKPEKKSLIEDEEASDEEEIAAAKNHLQRMQEGQKNKEKVITLKYKVYLPWNPISTAPKDGRTILCRHQFDNGEFGTLFCASWNNGNGCWVCTLNFQHNGACFSTPVVPTVWMNVPEIEVEEVQDDE